MSPLSLARPLTLATLAALCLPAQAATPSPRHFAEAAGEYELSDGRSLSLQVRAQRLMVSVGAQMPQPWQAQGPDILVSPGGLHRLHLQRDAQGRVERVALESAAH